MTKRLPHIIGFRKNSGGNSNMVKKAYAPVWKFKWPRSVPRRQYCSRVPLTLTHLYLWKQSVNSNFKMCPIGASMQIWIPAKAPATKVVRLKSRILIAFYHGRIGARIPLEVPEKPQSPHTHRHCQIKVYELTRGASAAPSIGIFACNDSIEKGMIWRLQMKSSRKFFGNVPKFFGNDQENVPENWKSAKFFRVFSSWAWLALLSLALHSAVRSQSSQRFALLALFTPRCSK